LHAWIGGRRWWAVAWFAAALLAKEECAAFPLVLVLVEGRGNTDHKKRWSVPRQVPAMLLVAVLAAARVVYATAVTPGAPAGLQARLFPAKYFLAQGPAILRYLRLLVAPYGFTIDPDVQVPPVWMGLTAWVAIAALAHVAWHYVRPAGVWFVAGLILLIP